MNEPTEGKALKRLVFLWSSGRLNASRPPARPAPAPVKTAPSPVASAPQSPAPQSPTYTPEQLAAIKDGRRIAENDFRLYFKRMRTLGQRNATEANEEEFWQYLVAADFRKADGETPVTKLNLPSTFIAWYQRRNREAQAEREERESQAEREAAEKERRESLEKWNDMMLRSENETNWADE